MNKFKRYISLVSLTLVVLLLVGCLPGGKTGLVKLDVTVSLKEGTADLTKVNLVIGNKALAVNAQGKVDPAPEVEKGKAVKVEASLEGYKTWSQTITPDEDNFQVNIELEVKTVPATEEQLVKDLKDAIKKKELSVFMNALLALQEAGLVTDVVEAHGPAYQVQAENYVFDVSALATPILATAADVQEAVIDPVNEWVAAAIEGIRRAKTEEALKEAWKAFVKEGHILLVYSKDVKYRKDSVEKDYVQLMIDYNYRPSNISDMLNIIYGVYAQDQVKALSAADLKDLKQKDIDAAKQVVADVAIPKLKAALEAKLVEVQNARNTQVHDDLKEKISELFSSLNWQDIKIEELTLGEGVGENNFKAIDDLFAEYNSTKDLATFKSLVAKARDLWRLGEIKELLAKETPNRDEIANFILAHFDIAGFNNLLAVQCREVAGRLPSALKAGENWLFNDSVKFGELVEAEVSKYLGLINSVNQASNLEAMKKALKDVLGVLGKDWPDNELKQKEMAEAVLQASGRPFKTLSAIKQAAGIQ